jgi:hypothetical protein
MRQAAWPVRVGLCAPPRHRGHHLARCGSGLLAPEAQADARVCDRQCAVPWLSRHEAWERVERPCATSQLPQTATRWPKPLSALIAAWSAPHEARKRSSWQLPSPPLHSLARRQRSNRVRVSSRAHRRQHTMQPGLAPAPCISGQVSKFPSGRLAGKTPPASRSPPCASTGGHARRAAAPSARTPCSRA